MTEMFLSAEESIFVIVLYTSENEYNLQIFDQMANSIKSLNKSL